MKPLLFFDACFSWRLAARSFYTALLFVVGCCFITGCTWPVEDVGEVGQPSRVTLDMGPQPDIQFEATARDYIHNTDSLRRLLLRFDRKRLVLGPNDTHSTLRLRVPYETGRFAVGDVLPSGQPALTGNLELYYYSTTYQRVGEEHLPAPAAESYIVIDEITPHYVAGYLELRMERLFSPDSPEEDYNYDDDYPREFTIGPNPFVIKVLDP